MSNSRLPEKMFHAVVRSSPLPSIDLLVVDSHRRFLLGRRKNHPAQGAWFVPGGRIRKGEAFSTAFRRIAKAELGLSLNPRSAIPLGVFQHRYRLSVTEQAGVGTHYIAIAFLLRNPRLPKRLPRRQHSGYKWFTAREATRSSTVHEFTKAYFALKPKTLIHPGFLLKKALLHQET